MQIFPKSLSQGNSKASYNTGSWPLFLDLTRGPGCFVLVPCETQTVSPPCQPRDQPRGQHQPQGSRLGRRRSPDATAGAWGLAVLLSQECVLPLWWKAGGFHGDWVAKSSGKGLQILCHNSRHPQKSKHLNLLIFRSVETNVRKIWTCSSVNAAEWGEEEHSEISGSWLRTQPSSVKNRGHSWQVPPYVIWEPAALQWLRGDVPELREGKAHSA